MKKVFVFAAGLLFGLGTYEAHCGVHASKELYSEHSRRINFVLPQIDGLNCYTADLHVHSFFSDGEVSPAERVKEAWSDGLDIMALTDHIETRRQERDIVSDLNLSGELARKAAKDYPELTLIKGTEISREPVHIGHYCALFTKDNNTLYSTDDAQTIRNARAQGAIITHNHPGWERTSTDYTEFEKKIYAEGLIDGIEVANGNDFYPEVVARAVEKKLYMVSATDIHATTASIYGNRNFYRDMTLIFAKDKSEKSLRKALLSQKTLAYCGGYIIGEESLLKKFITASVTVAHAASSKKGEKFVITNSTSFAYTLSHNGKMIDVPAFGSVSVTLPEKKAVFTVENMIHVNNQRPVVEFELK